MEKFSLTKATPVLFGFFIMGFCDVVGIASNYVRQDFHLSDTLANFLPFMVFIWFFVCSVPTGMAMNRLGRKRTVQISNAVTIIAMTVPFLHYSYYTCLLAFALLGIANTILQVSLNPLLSDVVNRERLTSSLTAGQFIKAISSFSGPFIASFSVVYLGKWQNMFPVFAAITLLSSLWLQLTPIRESDKKEEVSSFGDIIKILKNKSILLLFFGIVFIVGLDVGLNIATPRILMERCGMAAEEAGYGVSVYFACRTLGAFLGAFILARFAPRPVFRIGMIVAIAALAALFFASEKIEIMIIAGVIGFACANVFSIIFSAALQKMPEKANEVSGLMITGVAGGALIPLLMGICTDITGNQSGSILVITVCSFYLLVCAFRN